MAIGKVFRELKLDEQSRFAETDLLRSWIRTGLRYSDLKIALHDLILRKRLSQQTVGNTTLLQLNRSSSHESALNSADPLTQALDWLALRSLRNRRRVRVVDRRPNHRLTDRY